MKTFEITTDKAGKKFVQQVPDGAQPGPFADRTAAERELLDTVRRGDMTEEAWRSLQHLLEEG